MKMKTLSILSLAIAALGTPWMLAQTSQPQPTPSNDQVKRITLPPIPFPNLPYGPGRDACMVQCGICHTQRYVTMQPPFSRKVWTDEVNKMINTYKAQIPPDQVNTIVDYLVSIRGASK